MRDPGQLVGTQGTEEPYSIIYRDADDMDPAAKILRSELVEGSKLLLKCRHLR